MDVRFTYNLLKIIVFLTWFMMKNNRCLGSGSVGFAGFWLPGSGSAKTCGSTDPDPRGKISTKICEKPKYELLNKEKL